MVYFLPNQVGIALICWLNGYKGLKLALPPYELPTYKFLTPL